MAWGDPPDDPYESYARCRRRFRSLPARWLPPAEVDGSGDGGKGSPRKPRQPAPSERHGLSQDQPFDQKQHPTTATIEIKTKPGTPSNSGPAVPVDDEHTPSQRGIVRLKAAPVVLDDGTTV
jgi:hypothetical protein